VGLDLFYNVWNGLSVEDKNHLSFIKNKSAFEFQTQTKVLSLERDKLFLFY